MHPSAVVDASAELASDVEVGPYAIVGAGVRVGPGCRVMTHAVLQGPMSLGEGCVVHPFAALGGSPQDLRHRGEPTRVEIGRRNVFREHVTVHRGTQESATRIGDDNLLMVGVHVAHDAHVGSRCVIANGVQLAGHVVVEDYAAFGGLAGVAQFVRVGENAFVAAGAMVEHDVLPFLVVQGDRARARGVNRVGLERRGVPPASVRALVRAYREIFEGGRPIAVAAAALASEDPWVARFVEAVRRRAARA